MPMVPVIKAQWEADLRSGKYKQGIRYLCAGDLYCCLGVLCEQAVRFGIITKDVRDGITFYAQSSAILPRAVVKWSGLTKTIPVINYEDGRIPLSEMNDFGTFRFPEIAAAIKADVQL